MSTDIRASLALASRATQAARSDSGAQNQILDIGSDAGFPQILEQQTSARAEPRDASAYDSSRTNEREEAGTRQTGGKRLPAGADQASERRAETRRTERADARERADAAASQDAAASRDAEHARRSEENSEAKAEAKADDHAEKVSAENANGAEVAPPVDPAVAPPVGILPVILPESPVMPADADATAPDGETAAVSDVSAQAPSVAVEAAVLPATAIVDAQDQASVSEPAAAAAQAGVDAGLLQAAAATQEAEALAAMEMVAAAVADAESAPAATATQQSILAAAAPPAAVATAPAAETPAPQPSTLAANAGQSTPAVLSSAGSSPETAQRAGNETLSSTLSASSGALSTAESDALSSESGMGEKSAGNGADSDKGNRATPERVAAFREQLAVLAQQVDAGNRAAATSAKKSDTLQEVKGFALTRNMEQLSSARADAGKAASTGIQTPLTSREWAGEVGQRLLMMVSSKIKSAEIHLNPKELGPMEVRIRMHEDKAHVVFTSQVAQTREALEQAVPRLRDMLDQNGVTLGNVNVQDHGAQHSHQRQQHDQHAGGNGGGQQAAGESDVAPVIRRDLSLVDFYA